MNTNKIALYTPTSKAESEMLQYLAFAHAYKWVGYGSVPQDVGTSMLSFNRDTLEIYTPFPGVYMHLETFANIDDIVKFIKNEPKEVVIDNCVTLRQNGEVFVDLEHDGFESTRTFTSARFDYIISKRNELLGKDPVKATLPSEVKKVPYVSFHYPDKRGVARERYVAVLKENDDYIEGLACDNKSNGYSYKKFTLKRIIGNIEYAYMVDPDELTEK